MIADLFAMFGGFWTSLFGRCGDCADLQANAEWSQCDRCSGSPRA